MRRPRDPVAAYMLRRHPDLAPQRAVSSVLAMIRGRASLVDRQLLDELERARTAGRQVDIWSIGAGFDARWYRLQSAFQGVVAKVFEVDLPEVVQLKESLLEGSTYDAAWRAVDRRGLVPDAWTVEPARSRNTVIVLEGVSTRLEPEALRDLLERLRKAAPRAKLLLDLPGYVSMLHAPGDVPAEASGAEWAPDGADAVSNPYRWSRNLLRQMGWEVEEDVWLAARPHLRTPSGETLCSGMEALRLLRLRPYAENRGGPVSFVVRAM